MEMEYVYVPGTGLRVSRICIGAMMFGKKILSQDEADRCVDMALDAGINFYDTADQYSDGVSEQMLGKALGSRRKDVVIASKVGFPCMDKKLFSLSRKSIIDGIDGTLKRLGTDYLDIYYLHQPDYNTPLEESLEAMNDLVRAGKIGYIGMSNYAAWQMMDAIHICETHGWSKPVIAECCYNMLTRGLEQEMVPFMKEKQIGLVNFNSLAGGLLTGKYHSSQPEEGTRYYKNPNYQKRYWRQDNFDAIEEIKNLAEKHGMSTVELGYGWLLAQKHVTSMLLGFASEEQLRANLAALEKSRVDAGILAACDEIWDGLKGGRVAYNR